MSENAKHSAGPWTAIKASHGPIDIFDANDRDVVTVYGGGVPEDREANARLIAAAPDLLAALEALTANLDEGDFISLTRIDAAKAAIAKAHS